MNEKLKVHIEYLYNCTKVETLEYCFIKYNEYEKSDIELADYFFELIARLVLGIYQTPNIEPTTIKVTNLEKRMIINAAYQLSYEDMPALKGPLNNIFSELLAPNVEEPFIVPYMELIKIVQNNKNKTLI